MPKHGKYKRVKNQPSVAPILNITSSAKSVSATSATINDSERSASKSFETKNQTSKKRRRETGDSAGGSPQDSVCNIKKEKKKAKTMENNHAGRKLHENSEVMSEEMQHMEKRIMDNITSHNQASMKSLIQDTMKEMLKPIQDRIDNLLVMKMNMESQEG